MAAENKITKSRGLGRGLNALFEDEEPQQMATGATPAAVPVDASRRMVPIDKVSPHPGQPRRYFDEDKLEELARSIETHGILQPLLVRPHALAKDRFEIIAGERRWRAAQLARQHEVPVSIVTLSDAEVLEAALVENLQREDLNPVEEAEGYQRLIDEFGLTQDAVAEAVGRSRPHVANMVRLLSLPEGVRRHMIVGKLSMGHARALIGAENPERLAQAVIDKNLSVRETESLAGGAKDRKPGGRKKTVAKDVDTRALENDLSNSLGMRVSIDVKPGQQKGSLRVDFLRLDQLDDLLHRLRK